VNNRRKLLVALGAGALAAPLTSFAQQKAKVWRIGFLGTASASGFAGRVEALRSGLRDLGYVEVVSLARPGGNVTGMTSFSPEGAAKRLELLKDAFPRTRQVAVLLNPDNPSDIGPVFRAMEATAKSLKMELHQFGVRGPGDLDSAFAAMAKRRVDAVVITDDGVLAAHFGAIAKLAAKMRLPSIGLPEFAEAGGLMAYGVNRLDSFRRAAYFVDRIFKGAKPADLPVEQATRFETVLNQKTAKALGLQFPQAVLARADRVIE
jgi:putative ABC transport system substrate-binding protein